MQVDRLIQMQESCPKQILDWMGTLQLGLRINKRARAERQHDMVTAARSLELDNPHFVALSLWQAGFAVMSDFPSEVSTSLKQGLFLDRHAFGADLPGDACVPLIVLVLVDKNMHEDAVFMSP